MFRPIKNFITYIQKNASGSTMFGSGATTTSIERNAQQENIPVKPATAVETIEIVDMEPNTIEISSTGSGGGSSSNSNDAIVDETAKVIEPSSTADSYDDADDIELQIKSSVMLKPPQVFLNGGSTLQPQNNDALTLKQIASDALQLQNPNWNAEYRQHNATTTMTREKSDSGLTDADPLQMEAVLEYETLSDSEPTVADDCKPLNSRHGTPIDDELQDFANDPMANMISDDLCSVDSAAERTADEETLEDFITEEEVEVDVNDCDDGFIKLEDLRNPDLIIVNDSDLNSSIASDALSEDPLATDNEVPLVSLLDNSTNDEASAGSVEMLWHIKLQESNAANNESDGGIDSAESTPQRCSAQQQQQTHEVIPKNDSKNGTEQPEELRSDGGSDSGLGSETSALLQTTLQSPAINKTLDESKSLDQSTASTETCSVSKLNKTVTTDSTSLDKATAEQTAVAPIARKPQRSNLKRRLETEDDSLDLNESTTGNSVQAKKQKRSINFDTVQVYYFPRQQGFGCVPSAGGCTLGMGAQHVAFKTLTLAEHAAELRRAHRLQLQENPRGSSSEDSEESEEDYLSEGSGSDLDAESNGFLQPMSPKQRRTLLKAAGVRKIDASEKLECRDIRNSREVCGCTCRDFCDPETCACSQAGIKCQVDRAMFPCGCSRDACGNTVGRVEFNPARVRTHFIHTLMRLEMENRQQQNPSNNGTLCANNIYAARATSATITSLTHNQNNATTTTTNYYNSLQTQSNYSSGYASPAYMPEQSTSSTQSVYYQQTTAASAHYASEMHSTATAASVSGVATAQYHQMDSLDGNLFSHTTGNTTAASNYGDMLPNYSNSMSLPQSTSIPSAAGAYHTLNYGNATPVSLYSSYHHTTLSATNYANTVSVNNTFSSCAVPTVPPYGSATTTASSIDAHYQNSAPCLALNAVTVSPSCSSSSSRAIPSTLSHTTDAAGATCTVTSAQATTIPNTTTTVMEHASRFINLNTPISSSSRLSQINDLLQHNRNTTAALVAVAKSPNLLVGTRNFHEMPKDNATKSDNLAASDSINTPPIMIEPAVANSHTFDGPAALSRTETEPATPAITVVNIMPNGDSATVTSLKPIQMEPPP